MLRFCRKPPFAIGFLQLARQIDAAHVAKYQYLKDNPGLGHRFSSL